MALNLKLGDDEKVQLLPPSCFVAPRYSNRQAHMCSNNDVERSQRQRDSARLQQHQQASATDQSVQNQNFDQSHQKSSVTSKVYDDIISRQAAEISELKSRLSRLEIEAERDTAKFESQLLLKEGHHSQQVTSLQKEHKEVIEGLQKLIQHEKDEHAKDVSKKEEVIEKLICERDNCSSKFQNGIRDLQEQLRLSVDESGQVNTVLHKKLKQAEMDIDKYTSQINQLKAYLGDLQAEPMKAESWKTEKQEFIKAIQRLEQEKEGLNSSVHLLNIRLNSVNEILTIQENELSKAKDDTTNNKKTALLTRWRHKVYALMVQQKSADLVFARQQQIWSERVTGVEDELSTFKNKCQMLEHMVSDRSAQVEMLSNQVECLKGDLTEAQQVALSLDDSRTTDWRSMQNLAEFANRVQSKYEELESRLAPSLSSVESYQQRLCFAAGRLKMLQVQFTRKITQLKMRLGETVQTTLEKEDIIPVESNQQSGPNDVMTELQRVTQERDQLIGQMTEDSQMLDKKINEVNSGWESKYDHLLKTVTELEKNLQEKSQKCLILITQLEQTQNEVQESSETIDTLKLDIGKQQLAFEKALEDEKKTVESNCVERLAEFERQLNDARREQAKAVVSCRQVERQCNTERERASKIKETMEQFYLQQIEKLKSDLKALDKERNLLMSTLRQEGLIGKLKSDRPIPVTIEFDDDPGLESKHTEKVDVSLDTSKGVEDENADALFDVGDLENLAAEVIEEDEEILEISE